MEFPPNANDRTDAQSAAVAKTPNRITIDYIRSRIANVEYMVVPGTFLTICILTHVNGFMVTGQTAPADPNNFNADLGRQFSYENAERQLWPLEGFLLREKLSS